MGTILHITTRRDWEEAQTTGRYAPSSLETEGFIHCSTAPQTVATANSYYRGTSGLVLLCIDEDKTTATVKYEGPAAAQDERASELFPHLYGPLNLNAVTQVIDFPAKPDGSIDAPQALMDLLGRGEGS